MNNLHDPEGYSAAADVLKKIHQRGGTPMGVDRMLKLWSGGDLGKGPRLPPQNADSEDEEITGGGGGTREVRMHPVPAKRKRRAAYDESDPNQARTAARGRRDEDGTFDEDDARDEDADESFPPSRGKSRADRDEDTGRFRPRAAKLLKGGDEALALIKSLHAGYGERIDAAKLLSLSGRNDGDTLAKRAPDGDPDDFVLTKLENDRINAALDSIREVGVRFPGLFKLAVKALRERAR